MPVYIQLFFWGIITAGMALVGQLILIIIIYNNIDLNKLAIASLLFLAFFVLIEELLKYFIIIKKILLFDNRKNKIIINSWIAGMGFSTVEMFIIYQKKIINDITLNGFDLVGIILLHILTFGFLGYRLAIKKSISIDIFAIAFVFTLHFIYNFSTLYLPNSPSIAIKATIITILLISNIFALFIVNKKLAQE